MAPLMVVPFVVVPFVVLPLVMMPLVVVLLGAARAHLSEVLQASSNAIQAVLQFFL
jgi:hypothetical protein